MQLNGAEILIECLKEQGVDTVFGYPGGAILNVYDELYKHSNEIRHILTSHEQGASHAADGYARATGKVGVCFATSGPGATNLVTGIATAFMDSIPIVAITCNVGVPLLGKDSFQEIDITGITMPITKYNFIVKNVNDLAKTIRKAFEIAQSGRPGPVLIDIPKDVTGNKAEYEPVKIQPIVKYKKEICMEDIDKAVEMIEEAKRPFVFVGGGAILSDASEELRAFVDKVQCPVCDSLMGKGAFPGTDELYTGMLGMHGTKTSNYGVSECDLLIVVGARFSDRVTGNAKKFAKNAKILQFDVDAAEINKNVRTDAHVLGDAKEILKRINDKLDNQDHSDWMEHIKSYKLDYPMRYNRDILNGPLIMEKIYEITNGDAIITTDVGQHQMWASQYLKLDATHRLVQSGGLGTMGFGLPSAVGAQIGCPEKSVVSISGDGGFQMNMQELATAVCQELPLVNIVFNNNRLGMVRQMQELFFKKRYTITCLRYHKSCKGKCGTPGWVCPEYVPDFVKMAEAYGSKGYFVTSNDQLKDTILEAREYAEKNKKPVIVECMVAPDELVMPMIKGGASFEDIML